jgi:hypothetical protein
MSEQSDAKVIRTMTILMTSLFGFFIGILVLAQSLVG